MLLKKCVAFTGDNCKTMFGGRGRNEQGNSVFAKLKKMLIPSLIGVGCSVHVLNNCIHHGAERMNIDIENNVNKIYQYFSIYAVRAEQVKEYCKFANCKHKRLLSHSKTRWLSLFPGISRLLEMFSPLKSYFLSQEHPPIVIKRFFKNEMSELYLWNMQSLMSVFHERKNENFMSLTVKRLLNEKREQGYENECNNFLSEVANLFERCLEYLCKWIKPIKEFACFKWMTLKEIPSWKDVEPCLEYLIGKRVDVDDVKCFEQICNLKQFAESYPKGRIIY